MAAKRKRSTSSSPLSISSFGTAPTLDTHSPSPYPNNFDTAMDTAFSSRPSGWDFTSASRTKSSDWGLRTTKRHRDNRPNERAIHENTLHKLFSAQRNLPTSSPTPASSVLPAAQHHHHQQHQPLAPLDPKPQKSTLHAFWKQLPAPPVQPPAPHTFFGSREHHLHHQQAHAPDAPRCEDCDATLSAEHESMDLDVDVEMDMGLGGAVDGAPFACVACGRRVCGMCAVAGAQRRCLGCVGGARW
ncbi:hypothetical protein ACN47E_010207 [Coniothyrium glycines]